MPVLIEHLTELAIVIVVLVLLANGVIIALTVARRQRREKYFQRIDDLRRRYSPVIASLLAQKVDYQRGLTLLKDISGLDREYVLEQLLMEKDPLAAQVPILRRMCEDLGLVGVWQRQLTGRFDVYSLREMVVRPEGVLQRIGRLGFLLRAKAAQNLGAIRHQPSWPLLVQALDDPHADVRGVAVRALAAIREPQSFPALAEWLNEIVLNPSSHVSMRSIKSALVSFPLYHAAGLLPHLRHSNPRIRFLATDIVREMVEHKAASEEDFNLHSNIFAPEVSEIFLTQLCFDPNPDVRARSAPVIAYLDDPRATPVLLTLLDDPLWFVRLHTARALAKRKFLPQAGEISKLLTDPHWMVREAATRAMLAFGRVGVDLLSNHFLGTEDRYSREQIADEMQRAGLIPNLLKEYGVAANTREKQVLNQLAQMGKTSYLLSLLESSSDRELRKKFLEDFGRNDDPQIRAWVSAVATRASDPELERLARAAVGPGRSRRDL